MAERWVCGDCRSMNQAKSKRCYKCGVMRSAGEMTDAAAARTTSAAKETRTVLATATRMGARYRPTWPLALIVVPLIVIVTGLHFSGMQVAGGLLSPSGRFIEGSPVFDQWIGLEGWAFGLGLVSILCWSLWIAIVVWNVPALTAKWPPNSPVGAFFAPFIPFIGLWRPYAVVRGVLTLLTESRARPQLVALAWWLSLLAAYIVPFLITLGGQGRTPIEVSLAAGRVQAIMLVPAAVLAIGVVIVTERAQRQALRRREVAVLTPEVTPAFG